jgi:hypothetical protein
VAEPLAEAKAVADEVIEANAGLNGAAALELPACAVGAFLFAGFAFVVAVVGRFPRGSEYVLPAFAFILGIAAGVFVGRLVRKYRIRLGSEEYDALQGELDEEVKALTAASRKVERQLEQAAEQRMRPFQKRIDANAAQRAKLQSATAARTAAIRQKAEAEAEAVRQTYAKQIKPLHEQLLSRIKPKDEGAKRQFPAYRKASSGGYEDGARPSESEISRLVKKEMDQFMASLTELDRVILAALAKNLPSESFNNLFAELMSLSPYARRQRLDEIRRKILGN